VPPVTRRGDVPGYASTYRRVLVDTHIPDWDARLLGDFDAARSVREVAATGATGVMVYFQSHTGLCNWPTASGRQHAALVGRDVMREAIDAAHSAGLPACAYYSVNFNNWAWETHPEWRLEPVSAEVIGGGVLQRERYGICCLNHAGYRQFLARQVGEILERYDVDGFFFDMVWWMSVCVCGACRARHRRETDRELPEIVDWLDPAWCAFQAARERWLTEFAQELRETVRALRTGIPVYHNFALVAANWTRGVSFGSAKAHDFLGGDFYGGATEQLIISRLMLNLSQSRPVEFMTTVADNLAEHERLKPQSQFDAQCLAATASHAAFLAIVAHDPQGGINPAALERVRRTFARVAPYEAELGGDPVEDVAVYFSDDSKMNFADNGLPLAAAMRRPAGDYPHLRAVSGACRVLQRAHRPFGVVTRRQLDDLRRHRVLVLPNVLRMDAAEIDAVRQWVHGGGRLYASRYTSLTTTDGRRGEDFLLADVFGCHCEGIETGRNLYLSPAGPLARAAIAPERALSHWIDPEGSTGALRLAPRAEGRVLMTLTLPFGYPSRGSVEGRDWASIHSFPPWEHTTTPAIVEHEYGRGRVIYTAADVESGNGESHDRLFLALVDRLLEGKPAACASDVHPDVWMTVFDQPGRNRRVVCLSNQMNASPKVPVPACTLQLVPPAGRRFTRLVCLPSGDEVHCVIGSDGSLRAGLPALDSFAMYGAGYS
jgi:hypothetical protein